MKKATTKQAQACVHCGAKVMHYADMCLACRQYTCPACTERFGHRWGGHHGGFETIRQKLTKGRVKR